MSDTLLTLRDVHINFPARKNWLGKTTEHVHAINGIDLQIRRGETLGIVGPGRFHTVHLPHSNDREKRSRQANG